MRLLTHFFAGCLFGAGLIIAGMTDPEKVKAFLAFQNDWDPSLAFTLLAAILVHLPAQRLLMSRPSPLLAERFYLPKTGAIDLPLLVGAALFGLGWGWGGYCPGPAITSLGHPSYDVIVLVAAITAGFHLHRALEPHFSPLRFRLRAKEGPAS